MIKNIIIIILIFIQNFAFAQNSNENEYLILTFEVEQNKYAHQTRTYYGVAKLNKYDNVNEYKEPIINSIYLYNFYGRERLIKDFCSDKNSEDYKKEDISQIQFNDNYEEYLKNFRDLINNNRVKLQVIKKEWNKDFNEKTTIYGTVIKGKIYRCEINDLDYPNSKTYFNFPTGNFEIIEEFFTKRNGILMHSDFSEFNYLNIDTSSRKD